MRRILFIAFIISALTSCKILDPSIMLKTPEGYEFSQIPDSAGVEYKLAANDIIQFKLYSNDGFRLIDIVGNEQSQVGTRQFSIDYKIEFDGTTKLPVLGRSKIAGMTLRETELFLEEKYSEFYNDPYVIVTVSNRRVIIFPGQSGNAKVLNLSNDNTTLLEAIAMVGGLGGDAKAAQIKVIRGDKSAPDVYLIDLSTIDGMKNGGMVLQANDIIYVEPRIRPVVEIIGEITPVVSLLSITTSLVTSIYSIYVFSQLLGQ
ncbi:MAG: polysaccharide biosynthesis/export family protein [Flavobacteriales bacterium]|nr:polysaccharide biosynthesis/export family protein [Flavobacteriales bacterium]